MTKVADVAAKIVKVVATADSAFQTHRGLSQHNHGQGSGAVNGIGNPGPSTPEPTAALLFGLGAVVVGAGIRRRR